MPRHVLHQVAAPVGLVLTFAAACSSNHASSGGGDASPDGVTSETDAAKDARKTGDTGATCPLCDAGKVQHHIDGGKPQPSPDAGGDVGSVVTRDAGHDSGMGATGAHTTGVTIAVKTASGSVNRTYDVTIPADCGTTSAKLPVVFAFHGDGGKGSDMYGGFPIEAAAAAAGGKAIFVYPDGTDNNIDPGGATRAWDLYHDPGPSPYTSMHPVPAMSDEASGNVDVDFFDAMVSLFETKYCGDPKKIFITGMSAGGYLANQFGRWRATVVAGTAPQSGGAPFGNGDGTGDWTPPNYCVGPTGAVPTLIIHGDSDTTVDPCNAIEAQSYWDLANGCTGSADNCTTNADSCTGTKLAFPSPAPTSASSLNADCTQTGGCGSPVVLCKVPGMGHSIWSEAPTVIWKFFASL